MPDTLLLGGVRTPFGRFGGALREVPSVELAAFGMRAALAHAGIDPGDVDEVSSGVTLPAEEALDGSIPARVAMLRAGIGEDRLSLTLDRACCSSMTAVQLAMRASGSGRADVILAGGADNMGRASFLMTPNIRWGIRRGGPQLKDPMAEPGSDIGGKPVAVDAGEVAVEHGITREDADAFALRSHRQYFRALDAGFYAGEIEPFTAADGTARKEDEGPRRDTSAEKLARLRTIFDGPLVTPANAPGQDTGACYVVLVSERFAAQRGAGAPGDRGGPGPGPGEGADLGGLDARGPRRDRDQRGVRMCPADVRAGAGPRRRRGRGRGAAAPHRQRRRGRDRPPAGRVRGAAGAHPRPPAAAARRGARGRVDLRRPRPGRRGGARGRVVTGTLGGNELGGALATFSPTALAGKTALVTGGGTGMGAEIAAGVAALGG